MDHINYKVNYPYDEFPQCLLPEEEKCQNINKPINFHRGIMDNKKSKSGSGSNSIIIGEQTMLIFIFMIFFKGI